MKLKLRVIKTPFPVQPTNIHNHTEKIDSPSSTDKQILIEERINNYEITNLPNEITEIILVDSINSYKNSTETFKIKLEI